MSISQTVRPLSVVLAALLGAMGALMATAVAETPADASPAAGGESAECVALGVPFVHNPDNIKAGSRGGQMLPEGFKPAGGGVLNERPIVIACR